MPRAIVVHEWGGPQVLKLEDLPRPVPKDDEVLIRVRAASINPLDWKIREGARRANFSTPYYPGCDVAGTVEEAGAAVKAFKVGDAVYSMIGRSGGYAEYALAKAELVAPKPAGLDFAHAGAVPLAALTAWQMLIENGNLKAGQRVLVHAAAGGVGGYAVQMARYLGAYVIGTASARNHDYLHGIGAQETIDYNTERFESVVRDIDLVIDLMAGEVQQRSWGVIKRGGTLVCALGPPDSAQAAAAGVNAKAQSVRPDGAQLRQIGSLIDVGRIKVELAASFPLEKAVDAHRLSETGHVRGKIVLTMPAN